MHFYQTETIHPTRSWTLDFAVLARLPVLLILWSVCLLLTGCKRSWSSVTQDPHTLASSCTITSNDLTLGYKITLNNLKPAYEDEYFEIFFKERQAEAIWNSICSIDPKILAQIDVPLLSSGGLNIFDNVTAVNPLFHTNELLSTYEESMRKELKSGIIAYIHHSKKIPFKKFLLSNGLPEVWELLNQTTGDQSIELIEMLHCDSDMQTRVLEQIFDFIECYFPQLVELGLSSNSITELPASIGKFKNLRKLYLSENQLTELPASIGNLTNLHTLYLNENQLTELPASIGNLENLTSLHINANEVDTLPASIGALKNLCELNVSTNALNLLPACIGNLTKLHTLKVSGNRLTELPASIGNLPNLHTLKVSGNRLTELPASIGKLKNLCKLNVSDNNLTKLPVYIVNLPNLCKLNVSHNRLNVLPGLQKLTNLNDFNALHNPLLKPAACQGMGVQLTASNVHEFCFPSLKELAALCIVQEKLYYNTPAHTTLPADCISHIQHLKTYPVILFTTQLGRVTLSQPVPIITKLSYKQIRDYLSSESQVILIQQT